MKLHSSRRQITDGPRLAVFQFVATLAVLWLLSGFWQLQVQSPDVYAQRAERNRIKSLPLPAPRGKILDRDGRVLVDNSPSFKVLLSRALLEPEHLPLIARGLHFPLDGLRATLERLEATRAPEYQSVLLKENLTMPEVAFVDAHRAEFPELELVRFQRRLYPKDGLASHVVGYVGEISDAELERIEFLRYEPGAEVGKAGIERQYNDVLSGTDGRRVVVVDSMGRERRVFGNVEAIPGRNVRLTLDLDLQVVAELAMENRTGAVVALDPRNGEVLALVSTPNYFPDRFVGGIRMEEWRALMRHPDKPMFNRAIQAQLAPGSIFKPVVALAARGQGVADSEFSVDCKGGAVFYGRYTRCHKAGGHGKVTLYEALAQSCDVFFYTIGDRLGIDLIAEYSHLVGLGALTGIDLPHEEEGIVPSTSWKLRFLREKWYPGETISVAIGQGALTVTPLQIAHAFGGLALGGEWHRPHLISWDALKDLRKDFRPPPPERTELDPAIVGQIVRGLWGVVNGGGTGARARVPGYEVCGKTGSAQVVSLRSRQENNSDAFKDNAWFVGFAPCRAPEIVVAALMERGEHGHLAAPIVRDVVKAYFDKQTRRRRRGEAKPEPVQSAGAAYEGRQR